MVSQLQCRLSPLAIRAAVAAASFSSSEELLLEETDSFWENPLLTLYHRTGADAHLRFFLPKTLRSSHP